MHGAFGQPPVRYWLHNNLLTINEQKMSKSLGNFINLQQIFTGEHPSLPKAFSPMAVRFFMLQAHYRSTLDFSAETLEASERGYLRLMAALKTLTQLEAPPKPKGPGDGRVKVLLSQCHDSLSDDFKYRQKP